MYIIIIIIIIIIIYTASFLFPSLGEKLSLILRLPLHNPNRICFLIPSIVISPQVL